jgi:NADH-quinone oxidoreductase subunit C
MNRRRQTIEHQFQLPGRNGPLWWVRAASAPAVSRKRNQTVPEPSRNHRWQLRKHYDRGMTPDDLGARLVALLGGEGEAEGGPKAGMSGGGAWARATVDVPAADWHRSFATARADDDLAFDFFDWLSAVDELPGAFTVVAHLWSTSRRHGVLIRTSTDRATPAVASIVDLFPGAAWHERETHEMFGIQFVGHDEPQPLLLPPQFDGHPLRKDFVLATRVAKPWPGAKEPGESGHGTPRRQPMRPPGVPDPREWGPDAGEPG